MASLILIRHPETALNKGASTSNGESAERIRGWVDVPLDERGKREAKAMSARFSPGEIQRVYSSSLTRAKEAAAPLARSARVPAVATDDLRPWNLGILHGRKVDKVLPLMNKCVEHGDVTIPDGESFNSFKNRYLSFLKGVMGQAKDESRPTVLVTHSRNIQLARAWDKAGRPDDFSFDLPRMLDYRDEVAPGGQIELK